MRSLPVLAVLLAFLASCSCDGGDVVARAPLLEVDGAVDGTLQVDFGVVGVGARATRGVVLRNEGNAPLRLEPLQVAEPFGVEPAPSTIPPGAAAELVLGFGPSETGEARAQIAVSSNGGSLVLELRGVGVPPVVTCEPLQIDFGDLLVGERAEASVDCTNVGEAAVDVRAGSIEGAGNTSFSRSGAGGSLQPGQRLTFSVSAQPAGAGPLTATFPVEADGALVATVELSATGRSSQLELEPTGCLEYGFIQPGEQVERALVVRNLGNTAVTLGGAIVGEEFALVSDEWPVELTPDDPATAARENEIALVVRFTPATLGERSGTLALETTDATNPRIDVCLRGFGGGPVLSCSHDALDFGQSTPGVPLVRKIACTNIGVDAPDTDADNLRLGRLETGTAAFVAEVPGMPEAGWAAGESFVIDVTWTPGEPGNDTDTLTIETNEPATRTLPLAGEALDLPPCELHMHPAALRFGMLPPESAAELDAVLQNAGIGPCLLRDVTVDGEGFELLGGNVDTLQIDAGEIERLRVRFTAPRGDATGTLSFVVSDPAAPNRSVALSGSGVNGCLRMIPESLDFGRVMPGCSSTERPLRLFNTCPGPITVQAAALDPGAPFAVVQHQLPVQLSVGDQTEIRVAYQPLAEGTDRALLRITTADTADEYTVPLAGEGAPDAEQIDRWSQENRRAVDVLLVIDHSGSMGGEQTSVAANLPALLTHAQTQGTDFHIAVTTTSVEPGSRCTTGMVEDGRFFPLDGSHPRILRRGMTNLEEHYAHNTQVGACGGTEQGLEGAFRALSPPLVNHTDDPRYPLPNDGNAGFLRPDAALAIIFVSDDEDSSHGVPSDYLAYFRALKGWDPGLLSIHAIVRLDDGAPCTGGVRPGTRYLELVRATGGVAQSICTPDWSQTLQAIGTGAFAMRDRFPLTALPADADGDGSIGAAELDVRVNGTAVPAHLWWYDPVENMIVLHPLSPPEPGTEVEVRYPQACLQPASP